MLSGVYPPRHGVTWFHETIPDDLETIFDIDGVDSAFYEEEWHDHQPLDGVLNDPPDGSIEAMDEPFAFIEHDFGGHAPYDSIEAFSATEAFSELSGQPERLRGAYEQNVARSVDRFERRLEQLSESGVLENTLVIFTSDHGEHLGGHGGLVGHGYPPTPELTLVPTVFIHPSLDDRQYERTLISHVDLLPTVLDLWGCELGGRGDGYDGQSLREPIDHPRPAFTSGVLPLPPDSRGKGTIADPIYDAPSVWTPNGGHVLHRSRLPKRVLTGLYQALRSGNTAAYNSDGSALATAARILPLYVRETPTYGSPDVSKAEAEALCAEVTSRQVVPQRHEITDETRETLADLGYR